MSSTNAVMLIVPQAQMPLHPDPGKQRPNLARSIGNPASLGPPRNLLQPVSSSLHFLLLQPTLTTSSLHRRHGQGTSDRLQIIPLQLKRPLMGSSAAYPPRFTLTRSDCDVACSAIPNRALLTNISYTDASFASLLWLPADGPP